MQKTKSFLFGILIGFINSLFGAGGGILVVPYLRSKGLNQKSAQASTLAVLLPLSAISAFIYLSKGYFNIKDGIYFIPFGFAGVLAGVFIMDRIPNKILSILFSLFLIYSGVKMLI